MLGLACVQEAMKFIEQDQPETMKELKELVLIEAPTGQEENRAKVFADKFRALGLEDVHIDRGGNVIGLRRGADSGLKVLIEGHLDTVFPLVRLQVLRRRTDTYMHRESVMIPVPFPCFSA